MNLISRYAIRQRLLQHIRKQGNATQISKKFFTELCDRSQSAVELLIYGAALYHKQDKRLGYVSKRIKRPRRRKAVEQPALPI
jgi:hypothetical protein